MKSMMKMVLFAVVCVAVSATARSANATDLWIHGSACWAPSSALAINSYGVSNTSSSAVTVICPVPVTTQNGVTKVSFTAYDRSSTDNVSCTMIESDSDGTPLGTVSLSTSGNSGSVQNPQTTGFLGWSSAGHFWLFQCSIPGVTASGASFLTALYVGY